MEHKEGGGPLSTRCIQEKGFCERLNPQYCFRKQRQRKGHPHSQNTSFKFLSELSIEERTHSEGENQAGGDLAEKRVLNSQSVSLACTMGGAVS